MVSESTDGTAADSLSFSSLVLLEENFCAVIILP
jgi:hypothetical protein